MAKTEAKPDNMKLWNAVEKTDPKYTKTVNVRGGFTAIGANYQRKAATAQFGPYGTAWGLRNMKWSHIEVAGAHALVLEATFFYPGGGEFEIACDIDYKVRDDSYKKLQTDVTTKGLSFLGFNMDVFLGMFDDNKYITQREEEVAAEIAPPPEPPMSKELFGQIEQESYLRDIPAKYEGWWQKKEVDYRKPLKEMSEETGKKILAWLMGFPKA